MATTTPTTAEMIAEAFAPLNAEMLERQLAWATRTRERMIEEGQKAYAAASSFKAAARDSASIRVAGSKAWWAVLSSFDWKEQVARNVDGMIARRDANISKALAKAGVETLDSLEVFSADAKWNLILRANEARITIRTILAGGYNIQRLHERTLIHVA